MGFYLLFWAFVYFFLGCTIICIVGYTLKIIFSVLGFLFRAILAIIRFLKNYAKKYPFVYFVYALFFITLISVILVDYNSIQKQKYSYEQNAISGKLSLKQAIYLNSRVSPDMNIFHKYYAPKITKDTSCISKDYEKGGKKRNDIGLACDKEVARKRSIYQQHIADLKAQAEKKERERIIKNLPPYAIDYIVCDDCGHQGTLIIRSLKKNLTKKECSDLLTYVPTEYLDPKYTKYDEKEVWTAPDGYHQEFGEQGIHTLSDRWGNEIARGIETSGIRILDGDMLCGTEK
jgi:hypothetical protein